MKKPSLVITIVGAQGTGKNLIANVIAATAAAMGRAVKIVDDGIEYPYQSREPDILIKIRLPGQR